MGSATTYETWVNPMVRDWQLLVPMVIFWFVVQLSAQHFVLARVPGWKRFTRADQEDLIIRAVSIVNGLIMMVSAAIFLYNLYQYYGMSLPTDLYTEVHVTAFPFFRVAITSYFVWDLITCFWFKWAWAWKIHAIASVLGTYTLMFPFSDVYAGFYTGCFEVSNAFLHFSVASRMVASYNEQNKALADTLNGRAALCEYLFAFLFTMIRVVAGTFVTSRWLRVAVTNLVHDLTSSGAVDFKPKCHSQLAYAIAIVAIGTIQLLQYVWFLEIVKNAVGMISGGTVGGAKAGASRAKSNAKAENGAAAAGGAGGRQPSQKRRARKEE